jgi:hypothetical protein
VPHGDPPSVTRAVGGRARATQLWTATRQKVQALPWRRWGQEAQRRPRHAWRWLRGLPWGTWLERLGRERRLQVIAGGVALLLIALIVLLIRRGPAAAPPPVAEPVAAATAAPAPSPEAPPPVAEPVAAATAAPAPSPEAQRHLETAVMYQRKLWCSDALEELEAALRSDASLRGDEDVQRTAIACLTPKTRDKALRFLVERVGEPARAQLAAAVGSDANGEVRRGARMALDRLPAAAP